MTQFQRQNLTVSLNVQTVRKAKILAAKRSTSISGLVAEQIEALVGEDEAYERAAASAIARIKRGYHLGGGPYVSRDELHER
jgi:predicted DNA-binding protein